MLPLTHNLFNFGSWMGGDRDGNPYVTATTTRDVVISARLAAVNAFFTAIEQLMFEMSIWRCNAEMQARCAAADASLPAHGQNAMSSALAQRLSQDAIRSGAFLAHVRPRARDEPLEDMCA